MSLADALERAASSLQREADAIRPANGDPLRLREALDAEAAARVLDWLLRREPGAGEELAMAWAELAEGAEPLARIPEEALPRPGRKALRRALHRLRSRGVHVPQAPVPPVVATLPALEDRVGEARVTGIDSSGAQLLIWTEANPSGGVRLFEAVLDDARGILEFRVASASRSRAKRFLRDLATSAFVPALEVPTEAVRARLARVAQRHPADRPLPTAYTDWRGRIAPENADPRTPGELAREALGGTETPGAAERVSQLVTQGEIGPWPPAAETLRSAAERWHQASRGPLVLSERQQRERQEEVIQELIRERFAADGREREADRLEETAYAMWKGGREEEARACLQVAREIREGPGSEHPVVRRLLERALGPMLETLREEERSSLVVKP